MDVGKSKDKLKEMISKHDLVIRYVINFVVSGFLDIDNLKQSKGSFFQKLNLDSYARYVILSFISIVSNSQSFS